MTPREDDTTSTPPHGDTLRDRGAQHGAHHGSPASRHGVQLDPRGEPDDASERRVDDTGAPVVEDRS
jgi:hypothetical protein